MKTKRLFSLALALLLTLSLVPSFTAAVRAEEPAAVQPAPAPVTGGNDPGHDLGVITFDLASGSATFPAGLLTQWNGLAPIGVIEQNGSKYDLDKNGTMDVELFKAGKTQYIRALSGTNLSGTFVLEYPRDLVLYAIENGSDVYSTFEFRFPVVNNNYGTRYYDFTKDWEVNVEFEGDTAESRSAMSRSLEGMYRRQMFTMREVDGTQYYDLDKDGTEDMLFLPGNMKYQPSRLKPLSYSKESFDLIVPADLASSLQAAGKSYYEKVSFRFPAKDAGGFVLDLTSGSATTYTAGNAVEARTLANAFAAFNYFGRLTAYGEGADYVIDLNLDGNADVYGDLSEDGFSGTFTPVGNLAGDYTFTLTSQQFNQFSKGANNIPLYTTFTIRMPIDKGLEVSFDLQGHGAPIASQHVEYCNLAYEPSYPDGGEYWFFGGWYTDAKTTSRFDFRNYVTHTMTLYARWVHLVDVPRGTFFYEPVFWAVYEEITAGTDATHFSPKWNCTRGEVVTFLWRAAGKPEPTSTKNPFTDVKETAFYYKAVLWAVENGITSGTGGKTFSPTRECTRSEVVTFLWRAAGQSEPTTTKNPFKDVQKSDFFYKPVLWAVEQRITNGTSGTTFSPKKSCTRSEVVTFLYRAFGPKG